jgi:hypothetical protein
MQSSASVKVPLLSPTTGGRTGRTEPAPFQVDFRGIGVIYMRDAGESIEFRILYLAGLPQETKDVIAALFGVGAHEWSVCAK